MEGIYFRFIVLLALLYYFSGGFCDDILITLTSFPSFLLYPLERGA